MTRQEAVRSRTYRAARRRPRLGRLLTGIDQTEEELQAWQQQVAGTPAAVWAQAAMDQLTQARRAATQRRIDDGWGLLLSARRSALYVYPVEELRAATIALQYEAEVKLCDWRRASVVAQLAEAERLLGIPALPRPGTTDDLSVTAVAEPRPQEARAWVVAAQRLLDDASQHTYLKLRLLGQRLVAAAGSLAVVLGLLGYLAGQGALAAAEFGNDRILTSGRSYLTVLLLGVLGALLSFAIGTMNGSGSRRIYELATARFAAVGARLMVGAAAAVVLCLTIQSGVVNLGPGVTAILSVTAGFSERLVRRILEKLSDSAEQPAPASPAPPGQPGLVVIDPTAVTGAPGRTETLPVQRAS